MLNLTMDHVPLPIFCAKALKANLALDFSKRDSDLDPAMFKRLNPAHQLALIVRLIYVAPILIPPTLSQLNIEVQGDLLDAAGEVILSQDPVISEARTAGRNIKEFDKTLREQYQTLRDSNYSLLTADTGASGEPLPLPLYGPPTEEDLTTDEVLSKDICAVLKKIVAPQQEFANRWKQNGDAPKSFLHSLKTLFSLDYESQLRRISSRFPKDFCARVNSTLPSRSL